MYTIIKDLVTELLNVPAGEFGNWLLMCAVCLLIFIFIKL